MKKWTLKNCIGFFSYQLRLYQFSPSKYSGEFFVDSEEDYQKKNQLNIKKKVEKVLYCFWTGNNPLTPNRENSLKNLIHNSGVEVKLVTPENLPDYILKEYPLHQAYNYLSMVHRSDYLRCYFMHHYGGGYCDIKALGRSISFLYDELSDRDDKWLTGYRELAEKDVAPLAGLIGSDLRKHYRYVVGNGAYICKPDTPFTQEWYAELHQRLDQYYPVLKENPGNIWGNNPGYPIPWTNILGDIFHPLCLKYHSHLLRNDAIKPSVTNYR